MTRATKVSPERLRVEVPELLDQGLTGDQIARQYGYNPSSFKTVCSNLGISLRSHIVARGPDDVEEHRMAFSKRVMDKYRRAAEKRNMGVEYLVHLVLKRVGDDNLFNAVLDDQ
jgi:hypothetical protein